MLVSLLEIEFLRINRIRQFQKLWTNSENSPLKFRALEPLPAPESLRVRVLLGNGSSGDNVLPAIGGSLGPVKPAREVNRHNAPTWEGLRFDFPRVRTRASPRGREEMQM